MKKITLFILLFSVAAFTVSAQKKLSRTTKYMEWDEKPVFHDVPPEYSQESAIILLQRVNLDYKFEGRSTNVYYTLHRIVKLLDERGIETFNKIEIPVNSHTRVPSIKARTILPGGKVRDIAKEMIKVTKNEYGQNEIVIAMEGIEKNAEVEILLKEIRPYASFGNENFQYVVPVLEAHFDMSYPKEMVFEEKGFNGFPTAHDTLILGTRHMKIATGHIPKLKREPHSFYDLHRMHAEYKVQYFTDDEDKKRLNTWHDLGRKIYFDYYTFTDKEIKAANKYLSELGVPGQGNEYSNIRKIEDGIKKNIVLYPDLEGENTDVLDTIIAKKAATSYGYTRLFVACFMQAGVKFDLGMAGNRDEHRFDSKFENWYNMDDFLFYFPNQKKFLAPASIYYRYPIVPVPLLTTRGVFCRLAPKTKELINSGMEEIMTIDPLPLSENHRNIGAEVTFSKDMEPTVDIAYTYSGYTSCDLREAIVKQPKDREKDLVSKLVPLADKPENVIRYATANSAFENYYTNKPLEIIATVDAPQLIEHADKKYLFKLGEIIGGHEELYTDKDRKMPVDLYYPQSFSRTITIKIPKGYKVLNADDINISSEYVDKKLKPVVSFKSGYTMIPDKKNGDKLVVTVNESYSQLHFEPAEYERYRKVVNAGADFNKVTLLLARKS